MKYIDEFRDKGLVKKAAEKIRAIMPPRKVNIMEVCGTHTHAFFRFGLDKILPEQLRLISGPGCPVCVSPQEYIDAAVALCARRDTIILTFADMLRVPGRISTLEKERAEGAHVRVAYSALDSLKVARENPAKKIVFLAVGFETTAPTIALSILAAKKEKLKNLFFFSSLKLIPPAMELLAKDKDLNLDGFLCPGHVSVIIGTRPYEFIAKKYKIGCCVAGFEPLDILEGIFLLLRQMAVKEPVVNNQYARAVTTQGNTKAQELMRRVFKAASARWRGLSIIPSSGLKIKDEFLAFDAENFFAIKYPAGQKEDARCRCHDVLKGLISPRQCPLFSRACAPDHPLGACMVSTEGACNAYFKYKK